jgi:HlyD family secretion protein
MIRLTRKRIILGIVAVLVLVALVYAFMPSPVPVQTATVARGPLQVIVEEEGRTEVADRFAVTAPVAAYIRRLDLEAGDQIARGDAVASLEPPRTPVLDPGSRAEAAARVQAAEATALRARTERERTERLAAAGAATPQALEQAVSEDRRATAELEAARATLRRTGGGQPLPVQEVLRSPVGGRVLSVHRRSAGQVNPGDTLVVIGNVDHLEVRTDVLSQDAVRIRPGTRVLLEHWGGGVPLEAVVRRVEPQGFTSISSLGVEEQRVTVVAVIESPPELWAASLGSGYRVLSRFVVWEDASVLRVPSSALFRVGEEWAVFVVEGGRAIRRRVVVGQEAGLFTEVVQGLEEGDVVVVHPGNHVEDGARVSPREDGA